MKGFVNCILIGENFNPYNLKIPEIIQSTLQKKGDIGTIGRFKNQKLKYGSVNLTLAYGNKIHLDDELTAMLEVLSDNYYNITQMGVEEILLTLNINFEKQCNWEFNIQQLQHIVDMKISFSFSCY